MKTGNYRLDARTIRVGWLRRPREVQVLQIEIEGPIDACMNRGRHWIDATGSDVVALRNKERDAAVELALCSSEVKRLRARLDAIAETAERL